MLIDERRVRERYKREMGSRSHSRSAASSMEYRKQEAPLLGNETLMMMKGMSSLE